MHKNLKNRLPPFRPILSVIGTHPYKLAIYLVPIWSNITQNDFTVQDFFDFVHETSTQDSDLYMASLGVDAFRTNIQLDQTDICVKKLFQDLKAFDKGRLSTRKTINYLRNFIDPCIKSLFNKLYTPKVIAQNLPKRNVFLKLPFLGSNLFQIQEKLLKLLLRP